MAIRTKEWRDNGSNVLMTDGVHGYETSGVQGEPSCLRATQRRRIMITSISLWHPALVRGPTNMCNDGRLICWIPIVLLCPTTMRHDKRKYPELSWIILNQSSWSAERIDVSCRFARNDGYRCHGIHACETCQGGPNKAGLSHDGEIISEGFHLVGDSFNPSLDFQTSIIDHRVGQFTHIALTDAQGRIIDVPIAQDGVIVMPFKELGLCCGEVYADSPKKLTDDDCNRGQVAANKEH